ncbi:alpha/beta hydrolase [marine bacterium AO1-C]|nr:alpha/beta hydrolase [marine bacterium AO1-C]
MPLINTTTYQSPRWLINRHLQTVYPHIFRSVKGVHYQRERIDTPDGDFLDLDWWKPAQKQPKRLAIISHGLEGNTHRAYIKGMARAFYQNDWAALAWNLRGCSGEDNRLLQAYHSGFTVDLATVVNHVLASNDYDEIVLVGFSLGGNLTLKYLGEQGEALDSKITRGVALSTPVDLSSCAVELHKRHNFVYARRFLRSLKQKVRTKIAQFPGELDQAILKHMKTLNDFDELYTAPVNGFQNAQDYYTKSSSRYFLDTIAVPTLIINAQNDTFLAPPCYPTEQVAKLDKVFLEIPAQGGHCGFTSVQKAGLYWSESRTLDFMNGALEI